MKTPNIGISEKNLHAVAQMLNQLLADEFVLYTKTRNYHWNVTGPHFHDLHKFFEAQYEQLNTVVDDVAERARTLGGHAVATLGEYSALTRLKENSATTLDAHSMIADLLNAHEALIQTLRKDLDTCTTSYQDAGTTDFLTSLMEQHEKMAWMLRATLKN